jgi:hypothetical protein
MPALKKVAPVILKEVLEVADWTLYAEDKWNWCLVKEGDSVQIPKKGRLVSFQVMENALRQAEMAWGDYFRCLAIVEEARRLKGLPVDGIPHRLRAN